MCDINHLIYRIEQERNGTYSVQRYNLVTNEYETIHTNLSEISANKIKRELDAYLQV